MSSLKADLPTGPELCVGDVVHHRLRPADHHFSYKVFFLRIPLSRLQALPNRWLSRERFNLLSFHARDYGARDGSDLLVWARAQLAAAGLAHIDGEVVLQTFPRLLGYVFNPISLWYCHDSAGALRAVIAEVNNTFGERHNYVLCNHDGDVIAPGAWLSTRKQLHVSPFCEVRGHYRFRFVQDSVRSLAHIDYCDGPSEDDRLILTTIVGKPRALDARSTLHAFTHYPLFTLGVMARIHWQAFKLWRKRVPWFRKPPPPEFETSL